MKKIIILAILALVVATSVFFISQRDDVTETQQRYVSGEPLDLVLTMANDWQVNLSATSTENQLSLEEFINNDLFDPETRQELLEQTEVPVFDPPLDVIFCQANVPPRLVGRTVLETPTKSQVMVVARGSEERSPYQAIVSLDGNGEGAWVITGIECVQGETAPDVEFTFDREGYLLKSVPAPYQTGEWHVVFEQDGQMGYVAPLAFDSDSICIDLTGNETTCDPNSLQEPLPALVQGEMTEVGITVKRVTFK